MASRTQIDKGPSCKIGWLSFTTAIATHGTLTMTLISTPIRLRVIGRDPTWNARTETAMPSSNNCIRRPLNSAISTVQSTSPTRSIHGLVVEQLSLPSLTASWTSFDSLKICVWLDTTHGLGAFVGRDNIAEWHQHGWQLVAGTYTLLYSFKWDQVYYRQIRVTWLAWAFLLMFLSYLPSLVPRSVFLPHYCYRGWQPYLHTSRDKPCSACLYSNMEMNHMGQITAMGPKNISTTLKSCSASIGY